MPIGKRRPGIDEKPSVSIKGVLDHILKLIRTDYGAHAKTAIPNRLRKDGIPITVDTEAAYRCGAKCARETIKKSMTKQVQHIRDLIGID